MEHVDYQNQLRGYKRKIGQSLIFLASVLVAVSIHQSLTDDQSFAVRIMTICTMVMCFLQSTLVYLTVDDTPVKPPPPPTPSSETSKANAQETPIHATPGLQYWAPRPGSAELAQLLNDVQGRNSGFFGPARECFIKEASRTSSGYFIPAFDKTDQKDNKYSEATVGPATASAPGPQVHVGHDEPDKPETPEHGDD